jgi:Flp pilus assembly protein TadG
MHRRWRWKRQKGSIAVMVAAALTAILGLAALGTDVGRLYIERQRLNNVADAAALAGAGRLPHDPDGALATARTYLQRNSVDPAGARVSLTADNRQISIALDSTVGMTFARIIGPDTVPVAGGAAAQVGNLSGYNGAVPLGVPQADWRTGEQVTLKLDADSGTIAPGNYMALALGKTGSSTYEYNLKTGYQSWIRAGDWIATETGNMASPTVRGINSRLLKDPFSTWQTVKRQSPRLVVVPVLRDYNVNGRGEVLVVGFAMFFIEYAVDYGNNKGEIKGRFVRMVTEGEYSQTAPDFGVYVTKLIR